MNNIIESRYHSVVYYLVIMISVLAVFILLIYSSEGNEFWQNLSLNIATELIGSILVIIVIERLFQQLINSKEIEKVADFLKLQFEEAIDGVEHDGNSLTKAIEVLQCYSWYKWIHRGDQTGFLELVAQVEDPTRGIVPRVKTAILWELERIRKEGYESGTLISKRDSSLEVQLIRLLEAEEQSRG
jgi:hypothetical protein